MIYKILYSLIVFIGAFLTFMFQPVVGKILTPQYGGGADIWASCLVFFQFVLFSGYLLAMVLNKLNPKVNAVVYSILFIISCALFNIPTEFGSWLINISGFGQNPLLSLFASLFKYAMLPVLVLSTISVSMQNWYTKQTGESPYILYSVSNIGSFLALFIYPLCYEPIMTLTSTIKLWHIAFSVLTFFILAAASFYFTQPKKVEEKENKEKEKISLKKFLYWITLSAAGCIILTSYTTYATVRILPMPLLWTFFLGVYLLTFVLCFGSERFYKKQFFIKSVFIISIFYAIVCKFNLPSMFQIFILVLIFFAFLMIINGEIYKTRPNPSRLSEFYLSIAFGGVLGGIFVNIVAPLIFSTYFELPLVNIVMYLFSVYLFIEPVLKNRPFNKASYIKLASVTLITVIVACTCIISLNPKDKNNLIKTTRNFYGVSSVRTNVKDNVKVILNGNTLHGVQIYNSKTNIYKTTPLTYYSDVSAFAFIYAGMKDYQTIKQRPLNIGAVGLGAGTVASYIKKNDKITFYEIDPKMVKAAKEEFTFLKEAKGNADIKIGDARLVLDKLEGQEYDIILIDAFSSDSVPVHLITKEAFDIYKKHAKRDGIILFHISNRYLMLDKALKKLADEDKLNSVLFNTLFFVEKGTKPKNKIYENPSVYFIVFMPENKLYKKFKDFNYGAYNQDRARIIKIFTSTPQDDKFLKPFTDDYSSLFRIIRLWQ